MAPPTRPREPSIERTPEYAKFIRDLAEYHSKRGTHFEPEPRVGSRHVDLLRLFNAVVARGGYDAVSSQKLAWRTLGQDFNLGTSNLPALAFNLKTAYYRNLAAYEISTVHGQMPPPREILEDISARGGDLLHRTLQSFKPHGNREQLSTSNGEEAEGSVAEEQSISRDDKGDDEESGKRVMRGLRQAPPQRVLFQPTTMGSKNARQNLGSVNLPGPVGSNSYLGGFSSALDCNMPPALASYEPRPPTTVPLRPVVTPGNNLIAFMENIRAAKQAVTNRAGFSDGLDPRSALCGWLPQGPNIYMHALLAVQSGIPDEENFALWHLVRISHDHGEKFKFRQFEGIAEAIIAKALEASSLFYDVKWHVAYKQGESGSSPQVLDGLEVTTDMIQRIKMLRLLEPQDQLHSSDFNSLWRRSLEACLAIRNMVMLEENAEYLAGVPIARDLLTILLNLPRSPLTVEMQHYALDISEQITKYLALGPQDPLYVSLLAQIESDDRGAIVAALRAISCISMNLREDNFLEEVPSGTIERICTYVILDDEELVQTCLDFLYQYTARMENVASMLGAVNMRALIDDLARMLLWGARTAETPIVTNPRMGTQEVTEILVLPQDLVDKLLAYDDPERTTYWLKACFVEDPGFEVTQIKLWQAYSGRFSAENVRILAAADFIKQVSVAVPTAAAQIAATPGSAPKFVIRGLRSRRTPMDPQGRVYNQCLWRISPHRKCNVYRLELKDLWEHILYDHLHAPKKEDGTWDLTIRPDRKYACHWHQCRKFGPGGISHIFNVGMHVRTHMPPSDEHNGEDRLMSNHRTVVHHLVQTDKHGDPKGLPLAAALVLRNLSKRLSQVSQPEGSETWTEKLLGPMERQLIHVMTFCPPMAGYASDVLGDIAAARRRRDAQLVLPE